MSRAILIVEDEFIVANDLRLILTPAGYEVTGIAASGEEAYRKIAERRPDLVLLDIRLEGNSSGIDIAKDLRTLNIPFVFLSANSSQKVLEEAKATEPYGFLVKPFRKKDLLIALDIAWYRHEHSIEGKLRREALLEFELRKAGQSWVSSEQMLLDVVKLQQSFIPFDVMMSAISTASGTEDTGYLRIGYDEYQFISRKELHVIAGIKDNGVMQETSRHSGAAILMGSAGDQHLKTSMSDLLVRTFRLKSYLVVPVRLPDGRTLQYCFYSRQPGQYSADHIAFLSRLNICLTEVAHQLYPARPVAVAHRIPTNESMQLARQRFNNIIGSHHLLLSALDLASQVAPYTTSVLILGESGTGKEKVAQLIHTLAGRDNQPFVKVNCAAIPPTLIESELFGHEKGAFTGANEKRKGKFEQASGGTIFLDEIGELPLAMQVKLLRVLQEKEIETVGGSASIKIDVRVVAATNKNLEHEVAQAKFRLDLYYRLNVFPITLPPLRDRRSDIAALAMFFAEKFSTEFSKPFNGISNAMLDELNSYSWPGNIRELGNIIEQSVILNDGRSKLELKRVLVSSDTASDNITMNTLDDVRQIQRETERSYFLSILKKVKGRIRGANGAAELLNLKPTTLEAKLVKLNISKEDIIDSDLTP